ncbi:Signal transduction histidine kinase [Tenacibaculum sp. MAR_2010_89]|uniref:tetratricopeptide repeat-containing sensor histidine kinase n=1 Tax=Tenacibaculum sp. MAR_2010_89 TaxID=1250198 RepID=UPI0008950912|nr:tetratricopeptide repeat-containing sensor histidine kinase [Tenacibaculum sp. MAR_2010_89]SED65710.1 Signal transduction histidine kinase [Tenacibaculum sp. MAR_2010_89]
MKYKKILFFLFYTLTFINIINAKNKFVKIALNKAIFFTYTNSDTIPLVKKYIIAKDNFKNELYGKTLTEALILFHEINNNKNNDTISYLVPELIASVYNKTNKNKKAIKYYKFALHNFIFAQKDITLDKKDISREINNSDIESELGKYYLKIGSLYFKQFKNTSNSLIAKKKTSSNNKLNLYRDSALFYSSKLDKLKFTNSTIEKYKAISYTNLSALYFLDTIYDKAEFFALKAVKFHQKSGERIRIAGALNNLGSVYFSQEKYFEAKKTYNKAIEVIKNQKSFKAIRFKVSLYENLAWVMRNLGEVEAYDNLETSYELGDTIRNRNWKAVIKQAENKHNETIKELENEREIAIAKAELEKENTDKMLAGLSLLILIVSGVVIYNYRLRQNNLQLKLSQNKLIEKQNINRIKSESQIKILNATLDGKETERKQIAETLHDSVSALLSSANMHLRATKKQFNGNTPVELEKTQQIILEASQKVRDLSHNLVSSILLKFGLGYAIKDIGSKYSNSELHFHTNISNISRYNQEFEIKLYNVIHELINNILKHSKASNAHIVLEDKNGFLSVLIEDDGIGFNYKDNKIKTGLGLNQIEARIQMMNGNFLIESAKEKGTKATITVPIKNRSLVTA